MSATVSPEIVYRAWQPIGDTVSQFRAECAVFEREVDTLLGDLDRLRSELEDRALELAGERRRVLDREVELEAQREETNRIAQKFEHQEADLAAARAEIATLEERLAERPDSPSSADPEQSAYLSKLESQRASLEVELELVRARAVELEEVVDQQQLQLDETQRKWGDELKQLRRLIESRPASASDSVSIPVSDSSSRARATEPSARDSDVRSSDVRESNGDPVVSSVMAQFAKLQKDVSKRRNKSKAS